MKETECKLCEKEGIYCNRIDSQARTVVFRGQYRVPAWNSIEKCVKRTEVMTNKLRYA